MTERSFRCAARRTCWPGWWSIVKRLCRSQARWIWWYSVWRMLRRYLSWYCRPSSQRGWIARNDLGKEGLLEVRRRCKRSCPRAFECGADCRSNSPGLAWLRHRNLSSGRLGTEVRKRLIAVIPYLAGPADIEKLIELTGSLQA